MAVPRPTPRSGLARFRSGRSAIAAVALDLGGVIVRVEFRRSLARLARLSGLTPAEVRARIFAGGLKERHDLGAITARRFSRDAVHALGRPISPDRFAHEWGAIFAPYPHTRRLMGALRRARLRAGFRLVLFSNTDPIHVRAIRTRWRFLDAFDALACSYRLKALKPDPVFFARAARVAEVDPARTIFLDDRSDNVAAARASGFRAARARGPDEALRVLWRVGVL